MSYLKGINPAWRTVRFGEIVVESQYGLSMSASPSGRYPMLRMNNLSDGSVTGDDVVHVDLSDADLRGYRLNAGDLLFNRTNSAALVGKTAVFGLRGDYVFASYLIRFALRRDLADPHFVAYWFDSARGKVRLRELATLGVSQCNINPTSLQHSFHLPLPPLAEQKKIAAILGTWDLAIEKLQSLLATKDERLRALQQQLLTGTRRFAEFKKERWSNLKLGDVVTYQPRLTTKPKGAFLAAGIRSHGKGVFLKHDFEAEDIALEELWELRTDDLVVNITFGWEGAVAIVPPEANGALVSHRFPTFVFKPGVSFPGYFRHVIRQQTFIFEMGLASPGGAGRNRVLSKKNFLRIPIKLPPLEEQKRIAAVLNACAQEIRLLEAELEALKLQKRGLMQKLLTGDIRVKT